ncbi:uncharacterized protein LOC131218589 isoform X3 [Magnolia sinica]|uniref:uncharacterized protein LOC131218589 isoform X3 n=1 Tax=Magnolia sinica TaxID=86752 RepID=UPI002658ACCD|nr:uncharacterized protein LOC131218589 isoform X3 [Magnolia sinica]
MFFGNAIRSKLASLLHPWLEQEPDMDLELGFLHSNIRARNLIFDPSALNRLINGSSRLSVKRVAVANLSVRISLWEFPGLSIEISGVDVILAVRELEGEGCSQGSQDSVDLREKEMKAMLALIDPEVLDILSSKEVKRARSGRELWDIVVWRIGYLTPNTRSLWRLVMTAVVWLRHVRAYESLLLLIGYSSENQFKLNVARMAQDRTFLTSVKHQWKVVSNLEKELPIEAIEQARRIARYRAALHFRHGNLKSVADCNITFLPRFLALLSFLWKVICYIFRSMMRLLFLKSVLYRSLEGDRPSLLSSDTDPDSQHFSLSLGEFSVSLSPVSTVHDPVKGKLGSDIRLSDLSLVSFCLALKAVCLTYVADHIARSLSLACGDFRILSSLSRVLLMRGNSKIETHHSFSRLRHEADNEMKAILWSEPSPQFCLSEKIIDSMNFTSSVHILLLENYLGGMWSDWIRNGKKFEGNKIQYLEHPFLLGEIKSFLMDPYLNGPDYGLCKCSLTVGKLNFDLEYMSIMSFAMLLRQIQDACNWTASNGRTEVHSHTSIIIEHQTEVRLEDQFGSYASGMKMAMQKMIPKKHLQIGVAIAGPKIRMSMQEQRLQSDRGQDVIITQGGKSCYFTVDLENIEVVVWPTSKSVLAALTGGPRFDEAAAEYIWLTEPRLVDIPKAKFNETYSSQGRVALDAYVKFNGLNAFLEDLVENQRSQVIGPISVTMQSSSCRDYHHSFTTTVNALSMNLSGIAEGLNIISYVDELCTSCQVLESVLSAVSHASLSLNSTDDACLQELHRKNMASAKRDTNRNLPAYEEKCKSLMLKGTKFIMDVTLELKILDIIMDSSRENHISENHRKANAASSSAAHHGINPTKYEKSMPGMPPVPEFGIGMSVQSSCMQISSEEGLLKVLFDISGIRSVIFRGRSQAGKCTNESEVRKLLHQSVNCLYEFYLSSCTFSICAGPCGGAFSSEGIKNTVDGSAPCSSQPSYAVEAMEGPDLTILGEESDIQSCVPNQELGHDHLLTTGLLQPTSTSWLLISIGLDEIFMVEPSIKDVIIGAHQPNKLQLSLSIGGEFHMISCEIQGGLFFLETTALATFIHCFRAHLLWITDLSHISCGRESETVETLMVHGESLVRASDHLSKDCVNDAGSSVLASKTCNISDESKWKFPENIMIRLSRLSLVLATADGSGGTWELMLEADFHLKFELMNSRGKFLFNLSRLTILSQNLQKSSSEQTAMDILAPRFRSYISNDSSSRAGYGQPTQPSQLTESKLPAEDDAYSTRPSVSQNEFLEGGVSGFNLLSHGSHILKHIVASIMVEKAIPGGDLGHARMKNDWVGSGSVSGFDLTITLSQIEMILALVTPLSGVSSRNTGTEMKIKFGSRNQGHESSSENTFLDGAVVAIKDIHQHMYFAVEAVENKYRLVGVIHYSLAGQRALFRVRYHNQWRWNSSVSWFSLISLHAKNDAGEPLRLNFRPGSGFVDISSTDDRGWALWRTLSYKPESYEGDNDLESYNQLARKAFYLVNQKSDCGVAFVDGLPEFVKKPGHPFKVKLFSGSSPMQEVRRLDVPHTDTDETCGTNAGDDLSNVDNKFNNFPNVNITIDKVSLTILHEVSELNDKFPLLRGCMDNFQFSLQLLSSKTRLTTTFTAAIYYLDARRDLWKEIISPVEVCMFYRSRSDSHGLETVRQGVPVNFYFGMNQVDMSLTELSLDVVLFSAGRMNLAGPYAVRSSMIFPDCCKVENRSGLSLLCRFDDHHDIIITGRQSSSVFSRQGVLSDRLPENASSASVQLIASGTFSTSPIHISLSDAKVFAWRTRVVSLQDSRTFPGPFIVVDVSKTAEDGVSLVVSPLLRIHNASGFSMEIRFQRPQETEAESASVLLQSGDTIDDSMAVFDALKLSGGLKKALMSLSLGNFLLSFRPEITECFEKYEKPVSVDWSEDLKGAKAVRLSGIFDKLNYRFKKAFGVESVKSSFSSVHCSLSVEGLSVSNIHFLIQTITRDVPVTPPRNFGDTSGTQISPVALQEQKEIFLFPTVQVSNLLHSEIHVLLTESHPDLCTTSDCNHTGKQATIPSGSSAYLFANPSIIYFTVTLTAFNSKCKPVNSGDWVKKLHKQKTNVHYLDIELNFVGGKYFACLRLSCGERGILEATIFTSYTLQNGTDLSLFCYASNQKPLSREDIDKYGLNLPPELGSLLPPRSTRSWLLKTNKIHIKWMEDKASEALMDLDAVSGFTELCLEVQDDSGVKHIAKLGVSLKPCLPKAVVPSLVVSMVPRYIISNDSEDVIVVRQCYLEDGSHGIVAIDSQQKAALPIRSDTHKRREISLFDSMLKHHRNWNEDSLVFIQFSLKDVGWSWSGPICVASLGRFFLKLKRSAASHGDESGPISTPEIKLTQYAAVHTVEEDSSLVLHFHMPPKFNLPYRIENYLCDASITYHQKDSVESEILEFGNSVEYAWDDLNLPHKLVVQINGTHLWREINIDKVCAWKPFIKTRQTRGLALHLSFDKKSGDKRGMNFDESHGLEMLKVGYEVYTDGSTRVLRICEFADNRKEVKVMQPCMKIQFRVSSFAIHLLEKGKQDVDRSEASIYSTIMVARLGNITLDSIFTDQYKFNQIRVQTLNVDEKWEGAQFAAMIRRNRLDYNDMNDNVLFIVFNLRSTVSNVKEVQYSSIVLQPIDLNLDEETLMRLVPFWRTSLNNSNTQSQQYYFKHFEIHPIKIVASFLPGTPSSSYSSAQETLRSLLHNVIKIPTVKKMVVELNGVLLTHALVTTRELVIKCAQHYSWYAMRAIYIAKGSPLLPPAFASIFDDSASSSLDVFFDPSSGVVNLPGLTLGMFKFVSKCINTKGFSGTKRYFGDLGKTMKIAGSNVLFAAITEISDSIVRGAETSGFNGMVNGFHQGILKLAMEPALLGTAVMEGGPDRKIKLDRSPGVDELYIEGYLQAMLDVMYKQEYLRVRVIDDQVLLKNLPPNSSLIDEIVENVKSFLVSKALLKGDSSLASHPLRHLRGESEWKIGPTVLTLCEHLFVSFAIRILRKQAGKLTAGIKWKRKSEGEVEGKEIVLASSMENPSKLDLRWGVGKFLLSGMVAYIDGRLCRCIPNAIARRIVSGFLLSFLDKDDGQ